MSKIITKYFFRVLLFSTLLSIIGNPCLAQKHKKSRKQYEYQRKKEQQRIVAVQKILDQTIDKKEATLGQFKAIGEAIKSRERLIYLVSQEVKFYQSDIEEGESIIEALSRDLKALKNEYAEMIYAASKAMNTHQKMMFLFSANSFNQFMMRLKYLKQYSEARQEQALEIRKIQGILNKQVKELHEKKQEKEKLLLLQLAEKRNLKESQQLKDKLIHRLKGKENKLKREIKNRQRAITKLDKMINDIIKAEIRARKAKEKKIGRTPEFAKMSSAFAGNKGKMIWPVANGFISKGFGVKPHPVFPEVMIENNGVDIQTYKDEAVRCVHKGRVVTVAVVPGLQNIVMVEHGDFYTVYGNLTSVQVKAGDQIKFKDVLGTVYTDKNGKSELQFQVWKGKEKMNPKSWLFLK